jgi:hypothetical protein
MPQPNKEELKKKRSGGPKPTYDPKKIMDEMEAWVEKEDSIAFVAFCYDNKYLPGLIWRLCQENEDFEDCYMLVKMKLAERRERLMNANLLNYGSWNRYQKMYDPFLDKAEEADKDKDAARKKGIAELEQANLVKLAQMAAEGKITQQ